MSAADENPNPQFHFYSDLARKSILDRDGRSVGSLHDVALSPAEPYPRVTHLIVRSGLLRRRYASIPWEGVEHILLVAQLSLSREEIELQEAAPSHELTLVRDILDQQVVDINGQKVIRVNDVRLLQAGDELRAAHVDVGIRGIVRRLGWQGWIDPLAEALFSRSGYLKENLIDWRYIQPLAINPQKGTLKLTLDQRQLAMIPDPDISEMMLRMDSRQRLALFKSISRDFQPRVFSELETVVQKELLENMDLKEAADLLSRIPADRTTDLLEEIPQSMADSLLAHMETTQARRLSTLLGYTNDSAGGLMTTEMITVPHTAAVSEVIDRVRPAPEHLNTFDHIYLVDAENRLMGQVLLRRLILASPSERAAQYAYPKPVCVRAKDSLREVAFVMDKYRLAAVPVVNNGRERLLQGVITIDDILARIIPLAWKHRAKMTTP